MSSSAAQDPPQALNEIELGAVTRQPIQLELRMSGEHGRQVLGLMPRGIINAQNYRFAQRGGIGPRDVPEMGEESLL